MKHDIVSIEGCWVTCSCGQRFVSASLERSKARHLAHRGLLMAREALEGEGDGLDQG